MPRRREHDLLPAMSSEINHHELTKWKAHPQPLETTQEEGSGHPQIIYTNLKTETTCKTRRDTHCIFVFCSDNMAESRVLVSKGFFFFLYSSTHFPGKLFLRKEMTLNK